MLSYRPGAAFSFSYLRSITECVADKMSAIHINRILAPAMREWGWSKHAREYCAIVLDACGVP